MNLLDMLKKILLVIKFMMFLKKMGKKTKLNQIKAWAHSLPAMMPIVSELPENTDIAIEFNIPLTSKRIDFVISSYNKRH